MLTNVSRGEPGLRPCPEKIEGKNNREYLENVHNDVYGSAKEGQDEVMGR